MLTPLLHITLPDDDGPDRHVAPIIFALNAIIGVNLWHIRRANKRTLKGIGVPVPPLYASGIVYAEDEPGREDWRDCYEVLRRGKGDCVPVSTLVLRDDYEFVPIVALNPGDRIMGDGAWTEVRERVITGEKSILAFDLSNGCTLRCSPDHRLFRDVDGKREEVRAGDVRVGDDLVMPESVPLAHDEGVDWAPPLRKLSPEERAWLLGVFVADGWSEAYRSAISGRDGKPKQEQKRRVQELMGRADVHTRWHERYISINDAEIARFFATCGTRAPEKRMPSLRFASPSAVRAAIEGLAADAGVTGVSNTRVFSTTSPTLALHLRVLHRMLGVSTSIRKLDDHGGLGTHPIYRVIPREKTREGYAERRDKKFARVRAVAGGRTELCADIETDSGSFWLPESDVLVHNCDNLVGYRVAELLAAGIQAEPVIKYQHVPRAQMIAMGYPADKVGPEGILMIHCAVRGPRQNLVNPVQQQDGTWVEDVSKNLGMGGNFTNGI